MKPHHSNACAGNFSDWLEVMLISRCNGKCSWCIERGGYHPSTIANWNTIANQIIKTGKSNIVLLGGEPTLYRPIQQLILALKNVDKNVYLTTNGSRLTAKYVKHNLNGLTGCNISIHHCDLIKNQGITGVRLIESNLKNAINELHIFNVSVRFNCNVIKGNIDNEQMIKQYIKFAKSLGADKIRLSELKGEDGSFVDLAKELNHKYGLSDNPFADGCNKDTMIDRMSINFRQMCGLEVSARVKPINPEFSKEPKQVVYYDGKVYNGWQRERENNMNVKELVKLLKKVASGKMTPENAALKIVENQETVVVNQSVSTTNDDCCHTVNHNVVQDDCCHISSGDKCNSSSHCH